MVRPSPRSGFTLVELLVVMAIVGVLIALLMAAVQKARTAAARAYCANNLKQIGVALTSYSSTIGAFPPGTNPYPPHPPYPSPNKNYAVFGGLSWMGWILPHIEQGNAWQQVQQAYAQSSNPQNNPPHVAASLVVPVYTCPGDPRVLQPHHVTSGAKLQPPPQGGSYYVALTSYLGVNGTNLRARDGMLYGGSNVRSSEVTDGLSNTLLVGERPPNSDLWYGWWYYGAGQYDTSQGPYVNTGSCDVTLGVEEIYLATGGKTYPCPRGPYSYKPGVYTNPCDALHFYSLHPNGCNFTFADGSVRFLNYSAAPTLPALATRAGGEQVASP